MKEKYIVSYSTGKDSVLALYRAIRLGKDVVGLLVIAHDEEDISWFHDVSLSLIESVSKSLATLEATSLTSSSFNSLSDKPAALFVMQLIPHTFI